MSRRLVFLIGGSAAYDVVAEKFVPAAGGRDARLAVLAQTAQGWKKHGTEYVQPWIQRGVSRYDPIVPDGSGTLDLDMALAKLHEATGIFIGGGHTPTYHRLYATEPLRSLIRERYREGVPIAGVSAGALIALEKCVLTPDETGDACPRVVAGLGLVGGVVLEPHFTAQNRLPHLLDGMALVQTRTGWGIDDSACIVCEDGRFAGTLGQSVWKITMSDFALQSFTMTETESLWEDGR